MLLSKIKGKEKEYYEKLITYIRDWPGHDRLYATEQLAHASLDGEQKIDLVLSADPQGDKRLVVNEALKRGVEL